MEYIYDYVTGDVIDSRTGEVVDRIYDYSAHYSVNVGNVGRSRVLLYKVWKPPKTLVKTIKYVHSMADEVELGLDVVGEAVKVASTAYDVLRGKHVKLDPRVLAAASIYIALLLKQGYVPQYMLRKLKMLAGKSIYKYSAILRRYFGIRRKRDWVEKSVIWVLNRLNRRDLVPKALELLHKLPEHVVKEHKANVLAAAIIYVLTGEKRVKEIAPRIEYALSKIRKVLSNG